MNLRILFSLTVVLVCAAPAHAATWRVSPDPCPAPAAAAAYLSEPDVVSPDARDGVRPGDGAAPRYWPPAALTVELPRIWAGGSGYLWLDSQRLADAARQSALTPGCDD